MEKMSLPQLYSMLDVQYSSGEVNPLHIFTVFSKVHPLDLPSLAAEAGAGSVVEDVGENIYSITLSLRKRYAQGYLVDHKRFWSILIKPIESSVVAGNVSESWLEHLYPAIYRSYIKSEQLLDMLDYLNNVPDSKLELMGYVLRIYKEPETRKAWPRGKPYSRDFIEDEIKRQNLLLEAVNFVYKVGLMFFKARLSNDGHFVFYRGSETAFSDFQRLVLTAFTEISLRNHDYFSNRERRIIEGEAVVSQISLNPGQRLSKSDLENMALQLSHDYAATILYAGNPWLLVNLIDRGDGSSFDIHGYQDEIQIVPFNRASPGSLMKLFNKICELFPLTVIKE